MQKVFFITGASTGIGAAVARLAIEHGHSVVGCARSKDKLEQLADELGEAFLPIEADVVNEQSLQQAVQATLAEFGHIDVVFANAGVGGKPGGFSSAPPDSWKTMLDTNVYGLALTLQVTSDALVASKGHAIITSSIAGRRSLSGSMYSASKWAATCIGHGYRKEMAERDVRVTLIEPGMVDTPFFDEPKPGYLKSEDVARSVLFAAEQPKHVEIHELTILPTKQKDAQLVP